MKKEILSLLFVVMALVNMPVSAQYDINGNAISSRADNIYLNKNAKQANIPKIAAEYDTVRPLTEINDPDYADAYPWISPDGLRLYYIKETETLHKNSYIFFTNRNSILDTFANLKKLFSKNYSFYTYTPWLTKDELDIYFISEAYEEPYYYLHHLTKKSIDDEFPLHSIIRLKGTSLGFIYGPSLTQDKSQLFVCNINNSATNILIFNKENKFAYTLIDSLNIPGNYDIGSGKLSKDELRYYLSLKDTTGSYSIYYFERNSISESFDSLYYLNSNLINDTNVNNYQPTISENYDILVFTRNDSNEFSGNDLYIAYNIPSSTPENHPIINKSVSVFPNPFSEETIIEYKLAEPAFVRIDLYNYLGNLMKNISEGFMDAGKHEVIITADNLPSGFYYLKTQIGNSISTKKLIIKR